MKGIESLDVTKSGDIATSQVFSDAIEEAASANRVMRNYVRVDDSLREGSKILHIPKSEGALPGSVKQTNDSTVSPTTIGIQDISVEADTYSIGAEIHEDVVKETNYDILNHTVELLGKSLAQHEDRLLLGTLAQFSCGTAVAYSGDGNGNLTLGAIQEAVQGVKSNNFEPDLFVITPEAESELGTIDVFAKTGYYNVGEGYSSTGKIGSVLGLDCVVSTNIPEDIINSNGGTASCLVTDSKHSILEAVQSKAQTRQEFSTFGQSHQILASQRFGVAKLDEGATYVVATDN